MARVTNGTPFQTLQRWPEKWRAGLEGGILCLWGLMWCRGLNYHLGPPNPPPPPPCWSASFFPCYSVSDGSCLHTPCQAVHDGLQISNHYHCSHSHEGDLARVLNYWLQASLAPALTGISESTSWWKLFLHSDVKQANFLRQNEQIKSVFTSCLHQSVNFVCISESQLSYLSTADNVHFQGCWEKQVRQFYLCVSFLYRLAHKIN